MKYLLDTSTCVAALRGNRSVTERLAVESPDDVAVSAMTVAELWHGVLKSRNPARTGPEVRAFLEPLAALPFDVPQAEAHARIRADLEGRGMPIGERDLIIAATAVVRGLAVVTANQREFKRVPELEIEAWG